MARASWMPRGLSSPATRPRTRCCSGRCFAAGASRQSDAVMVVVRNDDAVRLVAIMTPPHALALSAGIPKPSRTWSMPCTTRAFGRRACSAASLWRTTLPHCGRIAHRRQRSPHCRRFFTARSIRPPQNVPGELRRASDADLPWLAAWQHRFAEQAGLSAAELAADTRAVVAARLRRREMFLWAVEGRPVSCAAFTTTAPDGDAGRINAVFTLEDERGKGYASACVAALSRRLLKRCWRYCLILPTVATGRRPASIRVSGTRRSRVSPASAFATSHERWVAPSRRRVAFGEAGRAPGSHAVLPGVGRRRAAPDPGSTQAKLARSIGSSSIPDTPLAAGQERRAMGSWRGGPILDAPLTGDCTVCPAGR